eukprot:355323-Chlamydomonas_euryale.AAC.5
MTACWRASNMLAGQRWEGTHESWTANASKRGRGKPRRGGVREKGGRREVRGGSGRRGRSMRVCVRKGGGEVRWGPGM